MRRLRCGAAARLRFIACAALLAAARCGAPAPEPQRRQAGQVVSDADDVDAIRAAYQERLRLGLGSPFRLIEIAAHDERLDAETRERLLGSMFERIADGETYDAVHTLPVPHQRIVEHAVAGAADPRVGELAVNLAYEIARLEHTVTPELQYAVACTAALLRDRVLAERDAEHVRVVARTHGLPPHTLVPALRAQGVLMVEQPFQFSLDNAAESDASALALLLIGGVRQAALMRAPRWPAHEAVDISADEAQRIRALHLKQPQPPQSALVMAMREAGVALVGADEEAFIAELAGASTLAAANIAAQRAAIALRPFAQERIWNARAHAPGAAELFNEYGVRVTFSAEVPAGWQPQYRMRLARALADMRLIFPKLNLQGLTIEFADLDPAATHLAYHDPAARLIRLAPQSISGSLAHELGHDLDWQIARTGYRRRAAYASDYAIDVAATMARTAPGERVTERPTELLARHFDWLVAAMLGARGRMNATLSSVQHDWLPGHGGARPPAANVRSADAFAGTLERAIRLDAATRGAIERAVVANDVPTVVLAVRAVRSGIGAHTEARMSAETRRYIELLMVAGGIMKTSPASGVGDDVAAADTNPLMNWTQVLDRMQAHECGPFTLGVCLR